MRLGLPDAQVDVILRIHGLVLRPHVAVPLERDRDDGTAPATGSRVIIRCRGLRLIDGRAMGTSRKTARRDSPGSPAAVERFSSMMSCPVLLPVCRC